MVRERRAYHFPYPWYAGFIQHICPMKYLFNTPMPGESNAAEYSGYVTNLCDLRLLPKTFGTQMF
jgi:hypothetical protein